MSEEQARAIADCVLSYLGGQTYNGEPVLHAIIACDFVSRQRMITALVPIIQEATYMSERDPRVDPRKGDTLKHSNRATRRVTRVFFDEVCYVLLAPLIFGNSESDERSCKPTTWRRWAKDAEVIQRGDDATD